MKLTEKSNEVFEYVKANGAVREKVEVEGAEKPVTYVVLTEDGINFVPSDDE